MITVRIKGTKKLYDIQKQINGYKNKVAPEVNEECAEMIVNAIKNEIIEKDAVASGKLFKNVDYIKKSKYHIQVRYGSRSAYYAAMLEGGTRGYSTLANARKIKRWMEAKGIEPDYYGQSTAQAAYLIARKIQMEGTKAKPIYRDAMIKVIPHINQKIKYYYVWGVRL